MAPNPANYAKMKLHVFNGKERMYEKARARNRPESISLQLMWTRSQAHRVLEGKTRNVA
jgi:hypothetical protein